MNRGCREATKIQRRKSDEVELDGVGVAIELGADGEAGVLEDGEHGVVVGQDGGVEAFDAALVGDVREGLHEARAHALVLPVVADDEGDLGGHEGGVDEVLGDGDDLTLAGAGHDADDGEVLVVVDVGEVLHVALGEDLGVGEEAAVDGAGGEGVEHLFEGGLVGGADGSVEDLGAVVEGFVFFQVCGVGVGVERGFDLVFVDVAALLGVGEELLSGTWGGRWR